jgi:hypothetical protein
MSLLAGYAPWMSDYERERIVEVPTTERIVEREVPRGRRTVVERRSGGGYGFGPNPVGMLIMAAVIILLLLLVLGALT